MLKRLQLRQYSFAENPQAMQTAWITICSQFAGVDLAAITGVMPVDYLERTTYNIV